MRIPGDPAATAPAVPAPAVGAPEVIVLFPGQPLQCVVLVILITVIECHCLFFLFFFLLFRPPDHLPYPLVALEDKLVDVQGRGRDYTVHLLLLPINSLKNANISSIDLGNGLILPGFRLDLGRCYCDFLLLCLIREVEAPALPEHDRAPEPVGVLGGRFGVSWKGLLGVDLDVVAVTIGRGRLVGRLASVLSPLNDFSKKVVRTIFTAIVCICVY